jgi:hypothetical protein
VERPAACFYVDAFVAACAILSLLAIFDQFWESAYAWLGVGGLARFALEDRANDSSSAIRSHPSSAAADFALQVIVPVGAMSYAGFLEGPVGVVIAVLIVVVSMFRISFASNSFGAPISQGLPLIWPYVGFLLSAFDATPVAAALAIGVVAGLNLLPLPWPHPLWSTRWQLANRFVLAAALLGAGAALWIGFRATPPALKSFFVLIGLYVTAIMILTARDARGPTR